MRTDKSWTVPRPALKATTHCCRPFLVINRRTQTSSLPASTWRRTPRPVKRSVSNVLCRLRSRRRPSAVWSVSLRQNDDPSTTTRPRPTRRIAAAAVPSLQRARISGGASLYLRDCPLILCPSPGGRGEPFWLPATSSGASATPSPWNAAPARCGNGFESAGTASRACSRLPTTCMPVSRAIGQASGSSKACRPVFSTATNVPPPRT